ncbi:late transcription factor VLTF3 [uncultured Mediterranean phage]|nr:late transcription factor VLTF3 [uncultured Mediterranean phage]
MSSVKERITKKAHSDPRVTIDAIHNDIISDMDEQDKIEYYLDNGMLLNDYYSGNVNKKVEVNKGVLGYFKHIEADEANVKQETNIINTYMSNIDENFLSMEDEQIRVDKCRLCNSTMMYKMINSELICEKCGFTETIVINSEKTSYKDPPREASYFAYKRINHFNEWLAQFQAKETTEIPEEIYKNIYKEVKKNINLDIQNITPKQVREILKKLDYNKYYEHIPHVINVLNGKKAPVLSRQEEEHLRSLFKEIQLPFSKNCPQDRKNFLSYSYVLHKFCELLEYDYLLPHFPLLKSREKLQQQDKIWKLICRDLQWEYLPSI